MSPVRLKLQSASSAAAAACVAASFMLAPNLLKFTFRTSVFTSVYRSIPVRDSIPVAERRYMSHQPKRLCTENMSGKRIGTHNGTFHCDEVLACFFLHQLPEYKDAEIVRTRDPAELAKCDIVVDVGGEFDPKKHLYDHHQRTFSETFHSLCPEKPWVTKLSSAGLVYLHFGRRVLSQLTSLKEGDRQLEVLYDKLYENLVEEVDAVDNGISQYDGEARYAVSTTLSARVGHLNPRWNSKSQDTEEGFHKALGMVGAEFLDRVDFYQNSWLPARVVVEGAVQMRKQVDPSGEVVVFSQGGCPWKEHLFSLEKELSVDTTIKFVLYPDQNGQWRVQCVPAGLHTFNNRLSLLEEWRGVRDEALSELSGIPDCVFVHAGGFIGGNKTEEGALEMARRTLQAAAKSPSNCS
ncbi:MYG1 exonuclease [Salvelinus alpinus]